MVLISAIGTMTSNTGYNKSNKLYVKYIMKEI